MPDLGNGTGQFSQSHLHWMLIHDTKISIEDDIVITDSINIPISELPTFSDFVKKNIGKGVFDVTSLSEATMNSINKAVFDTLSVTDSLSDIINLTKITDISAFTDTIKTSINRSVRIPQTIPIFVYLDLISFQGDEQALANIYAKHQKPSDYLIVFNNAAYLPSGYHYLNPIMTNTVTLPQLGSSYSSLPDAAGDIATISSLGYKVQVWDLEPGLTPVNQMPFNTLNCVIQSIDGTGVTGKPPHVMGTANWNATHQAFATGSLYMVKITGLVPNALFNRIGINANTAVGNIGLAVYDDVGGVPTNKLLQSGSLSIISGLNYYLVGPANGSGIAVPSGSGGNTSGVVWIGLENDNAGLDLVCSTGQTSGTLKIRAASFGVFQTPLTSVTNGTFPFYAELAQTGIGYGDTSVQFPSFTNACRAAIPPLQASTTPFNMNDSDVLNMTANMDMYIIQLQPFINGSQATLLSLYNKFANDAISVNPNCKIIFQMSCTLSTLQQMQTAWDYLVANATHRPDGVTIFFGSSDGGGSGVAGTTTKAISIMDSIFGYIEGESILIQDVITRNIGKSVSDTISFIDKPILARLKSVSDTVSTIDTISRKIGKSLNEVMSMGDSVSKSLGKAIRDNITMTESQPLGISGSHSFINENISVIDVISKSIMKAMSDTLILDDTDVKNVRGVPRAVSDVGGFTDNLVKTIGRGIFDTIVSTDIVSFVTKSFILKSSQKIKLNISSINIIGEGK